MLPVFAVGTPTVAGSQLIGVKHEFKVFVVSKPKMSKRIENLIVEQRESNLKYKNASSAVAASKYDQDILYSYLRSEGYYQGTVDSKIRDAVIAHQVNTGPAFTLKDVIYDWPDNVTRPPESVFGMALGDRLDSSKVLKGLDAIRDWVAENHCLRTVDVSYEATVHHPSQTASVLIRLAPSPQVNFGAVSFSGEQTIERQYLNLFMGFKEGECFKTRTLDNTRIKLLQTNLLANVDPQLGDITAQGTVPINFRLTERKQRSIGGGLGYDTDTRTQISGSWQHRNLLGSGEQLSLDVVYGELTQSFESEVVVPYFKSDKQRLTLRAILAQEAPEAYEVQKGEFSITLKRDLTQSISANVGVRNIFSRVKEEQYESEDDYALVGFPVGLDFNSRNDELNPTRGIAAGMQIEPFTDMYETDRQFTRTSLTGSVYLSALKWRLQPTLALRLATGTIEGSSLEGVPKDQRFYTGGGGSVRGYSYQSVGPRVDGIPTGGLAFSLTAIELRTRFSESFGMAIFADGGNTYSTKSPKFGEDYLWGAGIGLRYYTAFAPFRFDIAMPLNARESVDAVLDANGEILHPSYRADDSVQIYISIGQAF
ncbi:MAG: BamA/TamA family outer membrane protein [Marinagarivorans sp.]|nr:BamA/TamA family outer membrane protein [Marinagarivorans sp.]